MVQRVYICVNDIYLHVLIFCRYSKECEIHSQALRHVQFWYPKKHEVEKGTDRVLCVVIFIEWHQLTKIFQFLEILYKIEERKKSIVTWYYWLWWRRYIQDLGRNLQEKEGLCSNINYNHNILILKKELQLIQKWKNVLLNLLTSNWSKRK